MKIRIRNIIFFAVALFVSSCIGTDEVLDPIVGASIETDRSQIPLLIGDSSLVEAVYFNRYGIETDVDFTWESSNSQVATVNAQGWVRALAPGQSNIKASFGETESLPVLVTVVASESDVAQITISSPSGNQISIGQEVQLDAIVTNINGDEITGVELNWTSSNTDIVGVDENGLIEGLSEGFSQVTTFANGISSNSLGITVGEVFRSGTFQGSGGYNTAGSCTLSINGNGRLILSLSQDFTTDFALGTYVYLSNSTSGNNTANSGLEIAEITTGGSHTFDITSVDPSVQLSSYQYVIILCKPATITFGYAQLN